MRKFGWVAFALVALLGACSSSREEESDEASGAAGAGAAKPVNCDPDYCYFTLATMTPLCRFEDGTEQTYKMKGNGTDGAHTAYFGNEEGTIVCTTKF